MARRLFALIFQEHTFLILLRFFLIRPSWNAMKRILFFAATILSGKNLLEGGKNGEKENISKRGFGFGFSLNGKEENGMKKTKILFVIVACLSLLSFASAQELQSGSIRGRVIDDSGQVLPGVSITISGPALLGKVTAVTNAEGFFRAPNLTPGAGYEIRAEVSGFETTVQTGIIVNLGKTISIEIRMKPSTIQQEITITAPTPTVDVVKSSMSKTITSDVLASLPLAH